jgi:transposase
MKTVTTIGLDIAKSVFQVHGIDAAGKVVIRKQLKRGRVLPLASKLAPPPITGRGSSRRLDMKLNLCRQPM